MSDMFGPKWICFRPYRALIDLDYCNRALPYSFAFNLYLR
jgi:hypothetical protein